ncbi:MAG: hypothetical protein FJ299_05590 [Planctomycetes bacterium]|nr:hypothetical protein [Planctomycetota bacterium]
MSTTTSAPLDLAIAEALLRRLGEDLALVIDRRFEIDGVRVERRSSKPTTEQGVHISFRYGVRNGDAEAHGCLLVPLPEAISMASYLLLSSEDVVSSKREQTQLERATKDALLEIGNFVSASIEAALRELLSKKLESKSEGCQGVALGAKPAFIYVQGEELLVATARARVHTFPEFELRLVFPIARVKLV